MAAEVSITWQRHRLGKLPGILSGKGKAFYARCQGILGLGIDRDLMDLRNVPPTDLLLIHLSFIVRAFMHLTAAVIKPT
ncbi:hypothetical protein [Pseudomonas sp. W4I3]|uniref:hypothetical protein n=1 Tax=Pseudomonas sp. W4I3 TaxID=3042294 RepID=UPI00277EB063|nr:hypothetical protein [Pseudomonas sp. W4I3]MDQ0740772.1 hypothetical protein [Pseudomonas sp. W4I3]